MEGQKDREHRIARTAGYLQGTAMLANNVLGNGKSKTRAFSAATDHGEENSVNEVRRYAGSVVGNAQVHHLFVPN